MDLTGRLGTSLVVCGLSAFAVGCGGAAPPAGETQGSATPAASPAGAAIRADLIKDWERQKAMLVAIADAMPEEKFGFKSTPAQRSFGEHIMHVATVNVDVLKLVGSATPPPTFAADAKTKADILKALAASYDHGIALLNEQTDASITETIEAAFLGQATRARVFWFLLGHSMDTYGQLAVYLRLNGIVPPASRGV